MDTCKSCGHALGGARFCTSCGTPAQRAEDSAERTRVLPAVATQPPAGTAAGAASTAANTVGDTGGESGEDIAGDWRSDTAERPPVPHGNAVSWGSSTPSPSTQASRLPTTPPPSSPPPPPVATTGDGPRFPLFADQVDAAPVAPVPAAEAPTGELPVAAPPPAGPATAVIADGHSHRAVGDGSGRDRPWLPRAVGALVLVLVAGLGLWLLVGRDGSDGPAPGTGHAYDGSGSSGGGSGAGADVAREATATVPATAPPNQDLDGNMVRYEARNMLDGVPTTCWRMAGDGTGAELTFDLGAPTRLTRVGLINGYAKTAVDPAGGRLDWYHGNRRVLKVTWTFDDGTTVSQDLGDSERMQSVKVGPVTTQTVRLRLDAVSAPGAGRAARDYTPISDVSLVGTRR